MEHRCFRLYLLVMVVLLTGNPLLSWSQISPEAERRYKAAVKLVQLGDYERAKVELSPMTQRVNGLAPYAHYYYAVASFRQRNFTQARAMLNQLTERFPDWKKMDDAHYLYAAASLEAGQWEDGIVALQRITDAELKQEAVKMERSFLPKVKDLALVKKLQRDYPEDKYLAWTLIGRIQQSSTDKADLILSDQLTNRYGDPSQLAFETAPRGTRPVQQPATPPPATQTQPASARKPTVNRQKGYYNVAVLFPFRLPETDTERPARNTQFVYDLYGGMKLAKAKLQAEGITVNLFAYDLDNDDDKTLELINNPSFAQSADMIFGPMYAEPNRLVTSYAMQSEVPLINPIATSRDLVDGQPLAYLAQPSLNQQAEKAMAFAHSLAQARRAAVYYGSTKKDSALAALYQAELKRRGYQILECKKVSGSAETIAASMKIGGVSTAVGQPAIGSTNSMLMPGHVFIASSNEADGPRMIEALNKRRVAAPVIATSSAFDFYQNPVSTFTKRELYLLYPDFLDRGRPVVDEFEKAYLNMQNIIPSVYAAQGYDMLLFFGRQIARNSFPVKNSSLAQADDYLLSGFDYAKGNENQVVPIVRYEDGRFTKIN
ncbi:ABC transporter substrate-binding protein [Arsenicibacter rosenii]|uniref:Uncharacterized protein n=1 Tax=Arsenicibacter rosenii TaxID=1750698 RepID=A0A1S2VLJ2_9BACT|nr:ABC transporter substrate-binding protein [Arsenicibacter rosenii]OIN59609.1 hypothetical protein BLX24_06960 [Arsenicibacter rosenii]